MQLPTHFRRWVADRAAPSFREAAELRRVKLTLPVADEVLVRMLYATINAGRDTFTARREGRFRDLSGTVNLGADGLGQVVATGNDVTSLQEGDYVSCVFCQSFSEYTTPKAQNCFKVSEAKPEYPALRVAGTFAIGALEHVAQIESGKTILITAACGGVGHIAVQIAQLNGCHVVGTCSTPQKREKLTQLGVVDRIIDTSQESVREVLAAEYPSKLDYVLDGVGGEIMTAAFDQLAVGGKLLSIGFFSQYPHTEQYESAQEGTPIEGLPPLAEIFWSQINMKHQDKYFIADTWPSDYEVIRQCREKAFRLYDEGKLTVVIDPYPFENLGGIENVAAAIDYMLKGRNVGKVLIPF